MKIGLTGSAGFIGMHLARQLISEGHEVVSVDLLQPSYGNEMSKARTKYLFEKYDHQINVLDVAEETRKISYLFEGCDVVLHLAAWPGVRQSVVYPGRYFHNNVLAHSNMLKVVENVQPARFFYASSSSIYGNSGSYGPASEISTSQLNPRSYYAATKLINEIETSNYPFSGQTQCLALRFFTVFGPWGRPDMAYWKFAESILMGKPLSLYGATGGLRNFTYISDVVNLISRLLSSIIPSDAYALNIANSPPIHTSNLVAALENTLGIFNPKIDIVERPKEDADSTWADLTLLSSIINLGPVTPFEIGVKRFTDWFLSYRQGVINDYD
jgi:UDP-glucuronate 4-epimerase